MSVSPISPAMMPKKTTVKPVAATPTSTVAELIMTSGISGSGKSTWSRDWVEEDLQNRIRVNRDDMRAMMFTVARYADEAQESALTVAVNAVVESALESGKSVVVDATHLHILAAKGWEQVAAKHNAKFAVKQFRITLEEARKRVAQRAAEGGLFVPDEVIEGQLETFNKFNK